MASIISVVHISGPSIGFAKADIITRSLRAVGYVALLVARVDLDTIHLVGRWRSNMILSYLHTMTKSFA